MKCIKGKYNHFITNKEYNVKTGNNGRKYVLSESNVKYFMDKDIRILNMHFEITQ